MRKKTVVLFLLLIPMAFYLFADDLDFGGYVRNYTGIIVSDELDYSVEQNTFNLNIEYSSNNVSFLVNPTISMDYDDTPDLDVRQAYIDVYTNNVDLRIGKQQVVWGKADGFFITDVVSPKDLSEFLLPEFEEIRIGITSLKVEMFLGNSAIEVIGVPVFTSNIMPEDGSIWNSANIDFSNSDDSVDLTLDNAEIFARYSQFTSLVDFEIMGGYMWDDEPTITFASQTEYNLDHKRLGIAGGSFSAPVADFVVRGEAAFYSGKYFQYTDGSVPKSKEYVNYLVGIDFRKSGLYLSTQFVQKYIMDYDKALSQEEFNNTVTFVVGKDLLRETLHCEVFTYIELNDLNALIKPRVIYDLSDGLELSTGSYIFLGDEGTFGQFSDNNIIYTKLKYSF